MELDKDYFNDVVDFLEKFRTYIETKMATSTHFFEEGADSSRYQDLYKVEDGLRNFIGKLKIFCRKTW